MVSNPNYVLGVDLDNVTANYTSGLRNYLATLGHDPAHMPEPTDYCFVKSGWPLKNRDDYMNNHINFVEQGGFLSLPAMPNASEVLHKLVNEGVRIRIVTHRLLRNGTYAQSISDTVRWLDHNNIPFHDFCAISEKSAVGVNLLLDDAPYNITNVREHGGYVAVYDQPYNRHLDGPRVHNWNEIHDFVLDHKKSIGM